MKKKMIAGLLAFTIMVSNVAPAILRAQNLINDSETSMSDELEKTGNELKTIENYNLEEALRRDNLQKESVNKEDTKSFSDQNVSIEWLSADDGTIEGNNLIVAPETRYPKHKTGTNAEKETRDLALGLKFSVSDANLAPGEVKIKLPRYLFEDRDGKPSGEIDYNTLPFMPLGQEGGNTLFNYEVKDDHILITNRESIVGAYSAEATIRYKYRPFYIANGAESKFNLEYELKDSKFESDKLTAKNTTNTSFDKTGPNSDWLKKQFNFKYEVWNPEWGTAPENSEEYFYTEWLLNFRYINGTQKVKLDIEPDISNGELVGYKERATGNFIKTDNNKISNMTDIDVFTGPQSTYLVFKHKKEDAKNNPNLLIKNKDKIILNGIDEDSPNNSYDEVILESEYKYEPLPQINSLGSFMASKSNKVDYSSPSSKTYNTKTIIQDKEVPVIYEIKHEGKYYRSNESKGFTTSITESRPLTIKKVNGNTATQSPLKPGIDYYYSEVNLSDMDVQDILTFPLWGDKESWSGKAIDIGVAEISIKTLDDPQWQKVDEVKLKTKERDWGRPEGRYDVRIGAVEFDKNNIKFDKEATEVKVEYKFENIVYSRGTTHFKVNFKPTDDLKEALSSGRNPEEIRNIADVELYNKNNKRVYSSLPYRDIKFVSPKSTSEFNKKNTKTVQDANSIKMYYEINNIIKRDTNLDDTTIDDLPDIKGDVIYDLLPLDVNESHVKNLKTNISLYFLDYRVKEEDIIKNFNPTVEYINNWNDTGRTMMKITINYDELDKEFIIKKKDYLKINVKYYLEIPMEIAENLNGKIGNIAAYTVNEPEKYEGGGSDTPEKYEGYLPNKDKYIPFGDLNQDGIPSKNDTFYSHADNSVTLPEASELVYNKTVGQIGKSYKSSISMDRNELYNYRLRLRLPRKIAAKDLVFYDILENNHRNRDFWQGEFVGVSKGNTEQFDIDMKVYYSTRDDFDIYDSETGNLTEEGKLEKETIWTTEKPNNPKDIKAVAIDMRKTKNGEDFVLPKGSILFVDINMQASPKDLDQYKEDLEAEKDTKAYNTSVINSRLINEFDKESPMTRKSNNTDVSINNIDISVKKEWELLDKNNNDSKSPVKVQLYADEKAVEGQIIELNEDNNWEAKFENLEPRSKEKPDEKITYSIKEVGEEDGSVKLSDKWFNVAYSGDMEDGFIIKNKELRPWTPMETPFREIKVSKEFTNFNGEVIDSPVDSIEVELYRDGESTGQTRSLNADNNWSASFKNLLVSKKLGSTDYYNYTVKEVGEEKGSIKLENKWFNVSYEGSMKEGFVITNKESKVWTPMEVPHREVEVSKVFTNFDGNEIESPVDSIQVQLYKNGEATGETKTLSSENDWSVTFVNLPAYESLEDTTPFNYTVKEVGESAGSIQLSNKWFNVSYKGSMADGYTITNKESKVWIPMEVPTREVKVKKEFTNFDWEAIESPVGSIEVELYRNGEATGETKTLSSENDWSVTFVNLPAYESLEDTTPFNYTVKEVGESAGSIQLSDKWFNVLYEGTMKDGFTITNKESKSWTPMEVPTRDIKVSKEFTDFEGNAIDSPVEEIEVELYKDGEATGEKRILSAENSWSASFEKLSAYESLENTTNFNYTVKEVGESGNVIKLADKWFNVSYEGTMSDGFTITNKEARPWAPMEVPTRDIKVTKKWVDSNDKSIEAKVDEIEVELFKNGEATGTTLKLNKDNNWTATFEKLPAYESIENPELFVYTVKETGETNNAINLADTWFTVVYEGDMTTGFTVVNKETPKWTPMVPPTRDVKVTKKWVDSNDKSIEAKVDEIKVELYRNGEATGIILTLNKENNWTAIFDKLPVYESIESPETYTYTIKEVGEKGLTIELGKKMFTVSYAGDMKAGFAITNKEVPDKPDIPKTGESVSPIMYALVLFASAGSIVMIDNKRRRNDNEK